MENGVLFDFVIIEESCYLMLYFVVWKIRVMDSKCYWVISGDLFFDYILVDNVKDVKDVLCYFVMYW